MMQTNHVFTAILVLSSYTPVYSSNAFHAPCPGGLKCHHGGVCTTGDKDHGLDHPLITSDLPWLEETNVNGYHCTNCHEGWGGVDCSRKYQVCDEADPHAPTCFNGGECYKMGISEETGKYEYMCDCTTAGMDENGDTKYAGKYCQHENEHKCGSGDDELFCTNGGICVSKLVPGEDMIMKVQHSCECPENRDGKHCELLKEEGFTDCRLDCQNGSCVKGSKSYTNLIGTGPFPAQLAFDIISDTGEHCACPTGWTGLRCEIPVRRCGPKKYCYNGSTCAYDDKGHPMCDCNSAHTDEVSYAGSSCEQEGKEFCEPGLDQDKKDSFCTEHGKCINDPDKRHMGCECEAGWSGDLCDIEGDDEPVCDLDCKNGGSCRFGVKGYKDSYDALDLPVHAKKHERGMYCSCPPTYTGLKCEVDINHCHIHDGPDDHFCLNGVPCNPDDPNSEGLNKKFSCKCDEGTDEVSQMLTGRFCEYAATEYCTQDQSRHNNSFCTNGGKCSTLNRRGDSTHHGCCCPEGYEGKYCQFPKGTLDLETTTINWKPYEECANRPEPIVPKNVYVPPDSNDTGNPDIPDIEEDWRNYDSNDEVDSSDTAAPDTQEETPVLEAAAPEEEELQNKSNTGGIVSGVLISLLVAAIAIVAYQKRRSSKEPTLFDAQWWTNQHSVEWWKGDPDSPIESHTNIAPAGLSRNVSVESDPGNNIARQWSYPEGHIMAVDDGDRKWEYSTDHGDLHDVII